MSMLDSLESSATEVAPRDAAMVQNGDLPAYARETSASGSAGWSGIVLALTVACLVLLGAWEAYAYRRVESYDTDSSIYQTLAGNLADHAGYVFNFKPHTLYPPGFAIILALGSHVIGPDYRHLILLMPFFGTIGLMATLFLLKEEESLAIGAIAVLLTASSPQFFEFSTQFVLSELPYFCAVSVTLFLATRLRSRRGHRVAVTGALCACMVAGVMIRSAGVALIAAGVAALSTASFGRARVKSIAAVPLAFAVVVSGAVEGAWINWTRLHVSPDWPGEYMHSYVAQLVLKNPHQPLLGRATAGDLVERVFHFTTSQMASFSQLLLRLGWLEPLWFSPFVLIPFVLIAIGLVESLARGRAVLVGWYALAYLGVYSLWPFDEGVRFALPIFPLLFLFAWRGIQSVGRRINSKADYRRASVVVAAVALAALWSYSTMAVRGLQTTGSAAFWVAALAISLAFGFSRVRAPRLLAPRYLRPAGLSVLAALLVLGVAKQTTIAAVNLHPDPSTYMHAGSLEVAVWLRAQPDHGVVMAQQGAILHRLTGRRVVSFPVTDRGDVIEAALRRHNVSYLIVGQPDADTYFKPTEPERFRALIEKHSGCCTLARTEGAYSIYRVSFAENAAAADSIRECSDRSVGTCG